MAAIRKRKQAVHRNSSPKQQELTKAAHDKDYDTVTDDSTPLQSTTTQQQEEQQQQQQQQRAMLVEAHLPPLGLTLLVMATSGILFLFGLRDFWSTGKNIGGKWDEAWLLFTKSTDWFDDSHGWKSSQGGLSAIAAVSTDANNMGGLFVRKLAGGTAAALQLVKLIPLLWHEPGAEWNRGHFRPLWQTTVVANLATVSFWLSYKEDLELARAWELVQAGVGLLVTESLVLVYYLWSQRRQAGSRAPAVAMVDGKTPKSLVSHIVTRTVMIVTTATVVVAARDLFFPGFIMEWIPRDDIYLEWTNAFLHSPPEGSPESHQHGLEAPLYIGDKFMAQYAALNILILALYKYVTAVGIRHGSDGSGTIQARMIWKGIFVGDLAVMACVRLFTHAAKTASLDMRWHLVMLSYEAFIFFLYAFF